MENDTRNMESNNGFKPSIWGPYFWAFIHRQSMAAGEESWFEHLMRILPCKSCRDEIAIYMGEVDRVEYLSMLAYTVKLHDMASTRCHCNSTCVFDDTSATVFTYLALNYHVDRDKPYRDFFDSIGVSIPVGGRIDWANWAFSKYHKDCCADVPDMVSKFRGNIPCNFPRFP